MLANLFSDPVTATQSLCDKMSGVAENVSTSVDHVVKVHTQIEFAFQCWLNNNYWGKNQNRKQIKYKKSLFFNSRKMLMQC